MLNIPLAAVWIGVLCIYLPYNMGFSVLNPMLILAYALLSLLLGANLLSLDASMRNVGWTTLATVSTIAGALLVVNLTSGAPAIVLPNWEILLAALWLSFSGALLMHGLSRLLARHGYEPARVRLILRVAFGCLALMVYFNGRLPYDWKMWIAERTTNHDLIVFSVLTGCLFVGTWRVTR